MVPWKLREDGNKWSTLCDSCDLPEDEPHEDPFLSCFYCNVVQHEGCVPFSAPGDHPDIEGEWVCRHCWLAYTREIEAGSKGS